MIQTRGRGFLAIFLLAIAIFANISYYMHIFGQNYPKMIKPLPNPLRFNNGTEVLTAEDWNLRREEIKAMLLEIEYGHIPDRPDTIELKLNSSNPINDGGEQTGTELRITATLLPHNDTPDVKIQLPIRIYVPLGEEPFPMITYVGIDGRISTMEIYRTVIKRGYVFVAYDHEELDLDTEGYDEVGPCQAAYPNYDWGSLGVWAWGAMRVADILLGEPWVHTIPELPEIDPEAVIVTGHSRKGKTALIAGAFDERFTMVVPNGSGCGGAGSFLIQGTGCETLKSITSEMLYYSWFQKDFGRYGGKEAELPFDQHFLRALVAPRLIISTDGLGDLWANPPGTQAMYEASQKVFDFLNAGKNNAIHFREGGHDFSELDFAVLLDFADQNFFGKSMSTEFYDIPFNLHIPYED